MPAIGQYVQSLRKSILFYRLCNKYKSHALPQDVSRGFPTGYAR